MNLDLLRQGLMMTVLGMGLVFAALGLLWALLAALTRIFPAPAEPARATPGGGEAPVVTAETAPTLIIQAITAAVEPQGGAPAALSPREALTAERARVAALVTAALASNALPLLLDAPIGAAFEYGRVNPAWVTANRARALQRWQPPRRSANNE